jgi:hypothetical protein
MRLLELKEQTIDEAPMNPAAFGQAIAAGQEAGVLVGYEFEVCIPEETVNMNAKKKTVPGVTKNTVAREILDREIFDYLDFYTLSIEDFDNTFKFKRPINGFNSIKEIYDAMAIEKLTNIKSIFNKIPEDIRAKYVKSVKKQTDQWTSGDTVPGDFGKQLDFAKRLGRTIAGTVREPRTVRQLADKLTQESIIEWGALIGKLLGIEQGPGGYGYNISEDFGGKFNQLFDYDPSVAHVVLKLDDDDEYDDEYDDDPGYSDAAEVLKYHVAQTMGTKVNIFTSYHEKNKNIRDWYIEPDGSLQADGDMDATAEIVSPPLPAAKAIGDLQKFYAMAAQLKLYTNDSTGLHINVSIPLKLDILKLAVFLGDQYVLKYFNRQNNDYASSVTKSLNRHIQSEPGTNFNMKALQGIVANYSGAHTASISNNGKYISFRHAGGNYLADYNGIYNTVGRFVRAMIIASDPNMYANEYKTKLAKLINQDKPVSKDTPANKLAQYIRTHGVPIITVHLAILTKAKPEDVISRQFGQAFVVDSITADPNAKQEILKSGVKGYIYQLIDELAPNRFFTVVLSPSPARFGRFLNHQPVPGLRSIENRNWNSVAYYSSVKGNLPATDPRTQTYIKELLKMHYKG